MFKKLKNTWNALSLTRRSGIKQVLQMGTTALVAGAVAAPLCCLMLPGIPLVTAGILVYSMLGVMGGAAGLLLGLPALPGLIKEIRHGHEEVTWKNTLGQTVKSTLVQKKDLEVAQQDIQYLIGRSSPSRISSLAKKFQPVADKVTVLQDLENGDGKFHFARPQTLFTPI